jgi:8-hydroxy-5-deazaflavin:NADPH oxidoreductase
MSIKVGILGSGPVGQALAAGFAKHGFNVMIGTMHPEKLGKFKKSNNFDIEDFSKTAAFGEIVVLAVKGIAAKNIVTKLKSSLEGKIIIDTTNPIAESAPVNGVIKFFTTLDKSLMEELQAIVPKAKFVKAFNSIGSAFMVNPDFEEKPTMFICGNDNKAKEEVSKILGKFGFNGEDMGKVESARAIEPLCMLWCIPGFLRNDWSHAFKLIKK